MHPLTSLIVTAREHLAALAGAPGHVAHIAAQARLAALEEAAALVLPDGGDEEAAVEAFLAAVLADEPQALRPPLALVADQTGTLPALGDTIAVEQQHGPIAVGALTAIDGAELVLDVPFCVGTVRIPRAHVVSVRILPRADAI